MTKRPPPPMYGRVQRKAVPPVHRVLVPSPAVSEVEKQQQMRGVMPTPEPSPTESTSTPAPTPESIPVPVQAQKEAPKKEAPKKKASKKTSTKKRPKWDEDMTREELYRIAKEAGLEVRTRDWKHEIIEALKKARM